MGENLFENLPSAVKAGCILAISEIVFSVINNSDERYPVGRDALDKCWLWVESGAVTGDELYELIGNADYTGISEYMEEEENLNIALMWSLLVDTVAYTAWAAYKREEVKYLPQALKALPLIVSQLF